MADSSKLAPPFPFPASVQSIIANAPQKAPPQWKRNEAFPQPYHVFTSNAWTPVHPSSAPPQTSQTQPLLPSRIRLITWNIDAPAPHPEPRMKAALHYLSTLTSSPSIPSSLPIVLFLQEMLITDLEQIKAADWIRERFYVTDIGHEYWQSNFYGTTTLVDKRLRIEDVYRVHYEATKFDRDGLFVDVKVKTEKGEDVGKVLRVCNTHLESLVANPPLRPAQMTVAAKELHGNEEGWPHAGVLAGDCNAIQPFDRTLHTENGLKDAYLELGGKEDEKEGYTWGQQVDEKMRNKFGCSRMDKVMYCGGVRVEGLERIGAGVKVFDEDWKKMQGGHCLEWVTDHLGLMVDLVIEGQGGEKSTVEGSKESKI